ncbi:MAG: hypothetical protein HYY51_01295 [Candidatus Magasanikbacteria bacterium]|nr:hypothetical protein [Candidatus Magasanikbacteria bacterium]
MSRRDEKAGAMFCELAGEQNREASLNPNEWKRMRGEGESRPVRKINSACFSGVFLLEKMSL